ncbi:sterol carrier family protein [Microbacterium faecale]|nr:sterol carrier family protein [Microbacterium faecale]
MARKIDIASGRAAIDAVQQGSVARTDTATAVRYLLQLLEERAPGRSVEVRVPPFGAVQVIQGPTHTRGTPPNVVEMEPRTWVALATGEIAWTDAMSEGRIAASGTRADIAALIPVRW